MDIGRFLGIALLVLLLAGCQWLSPEDEVRLQTAATEPTPARWTGLWLWLRNGQSE